MSRLAFRVLPCALACALACLLAWFPASSGQCATFDERLWEKYADVLDFSDQGADGLGQVRLDPRQLGDVAGPAPFADLRMVTDRKEEVPWQIVSRKPERRDVELPAQVRNLSQTGKGETWLELVLEGKPEGANAVEIVTPDTDFSRQVEVLGSKDGATWNSLRKDGYIFDLPRGEKLRHTRVTFPPATFPLLALRITNGDARPLTIAGVKLLRESSLEGLTFTILGQVGSREVNDARRESSVVVTMSTVFPIERLLIATGDRNFQRAVEVQVRRDGGDWQTWARGSIFKFETAAVHESRAYIEIPEIAAREFRLVFKNLDSPPLTVTGVQGEGYQRVLVYKRQPGRKLYLFWGNPRAQRPQYDLAGLVARQKLDGLPVASLSESRPNTAFAGNNARLPFTERYKYLLYVVVTLAIAALIFLQYRVIRRVDDPPPSA